MITIILFKSICLWGINHEGMADEILDYIDLLTSK